MIIFEKFFGYFDMLYGAIVTGSLSAIFSFHCILQVTPGLVNYEGLYEDVKMDEHPGSVKSALAIVAILFLISSLILIYASARRLPKLILPWIVLCLITILFNIVQLFVEFEVLNVFIALFLVYFNICMYTFYKNLKTPDRRIRDIGLTADSSQAWDVPQSNVNFESSVLYVPKKKNPAPMCAV
ncbi:unnamed protein product [Diamesa serratosioi]